MNKVDNINSKHFYVALYERLSKDDNDGKKESESIKNQQKILTQYLSDLQLRESQNTFEIVTIIIMIVIQEQILIDHIL